MDGFRQLYSRFWRLVESEMEYLSKPKFCLNSSYIEKQAVCTVWEGISNGAYPELAPLLTYPEWVEEPVWLEGGQINPLVWKA